jgi:hypothetical protein
MVLASVVMFIPWLILQFIASVAKLLRLAFTTMDRTRTRTCTSNQVSNMPDTASTTIDHSSSFTRPSSALRKSGAGAGAASASSVTSYQRVAFNEHSNGSVRTENYYYDQHAQPGAAVSATVSNTPEKTMMRTPDQRWKMNRIQTPPPPPRQVMILPRRIPVSEPAQKENASNQPANNHLLSSGAAGGGLHKPPTAGRVITTARRLSKSDTFANSLVEYRPPLQVSSFSEQMRKRRLRGDDLLGFVQNKRQNHGRVALEALRQRNMVLSSRVTLSKRQREEREQRILKDMNRKRVKANPPIKPTTALNSSSEATTTTTQPTAQSTPSTAQTGATGKPQETSVPNGGFNFGSGDTSAATTNVTTSFSIANSSTPAPAAAGVGAPADAPTPAFSFGNTPVATPANSASPTPADAAAVDTLKPDAVAAPAYSFGSAAPPSDAPNAQAFGSTTANPVPPTGSFAATPAFGAATPLQPSTSGASARRRTKARQNRRR